MPIYRAALILCGLLLAYIAIANTLLLGGVLGAALRRWTKGGVELSTGSSFSVLPGRIELRDLTLHVVSSSMHLELVVPRGHTWIDLLALLDKKFSATTVEGDGFVLRLRPNFDELPPERRAALPPLSDREERPGPPSPPDRIWTIALDGVDVGFDELWISEIRHLGPARAQGGFLLQPQVQLALAASSVSLMGGTLAHGRDHVVAGVERVRVDAELPGTPVPELGATWSERLSAGIELVAEVQSVAFARAFTPRLAALEGGRGRLHATARVSGGRFVGPLELGYATEELRYAAGEHVLHWALEARGSGEDDTRILPLEVEIAEARLTQGGRTLARLEGLSLEAELDRAWQTREPRQARLELRRLVLQDLEALAALGVEAPLHSSGGSVLSRASARWHDGALSGDVDSALQGLELRVGEWRLRPFGRLELGGFTWNGPGSPLGLERAKLTLDDVSLVHPEERVDSWKLRVECKDARFEPSRALGVASCVLAGDDAKPALMLMGVRGLPPALDEFLAMPDLRVLARVEIGSNAQEVVIQRAESDTIDVRGRFVRIEGESHAAMLFEAKPLSLGVNVRAHDSSFEVLASKSWLERHLKQLPPSPSAR